MATTDFKETGKIKFSDINDLQNNSLTTGNIYASGTSADIGTAENPFNKVYANYYYGGILKHTVLFSNKYLKTGNTLTPSLKNYDFAMIYSKWDDGTTDSLVIPCWNVDGTYNHFTHTFILRNKEATYYAQFSFDTQGTTVTSGVAVGAGWTWVIGIN